MNNLATDAIIDYSVTRNRAARAEEATQALRISGHDFSKGGLLDVGCGAGSTTTWFATNLNVYSVGVELTAAFVNEAKTHRAKLNYIATSGLKLPFGEKNFHTVVLNDVLEHVSYKDADELFNEIRRVLDDDGMLYVSVANKYEIMEPHSGLLFISWLPRWIYLPMVRKFFHDEEVYPYTIRRFRNLAESKGFSWENFTWLYVAKKIKNINYIGNTLVRPFARTLNKLGLSKSPGFMKFLELFGVLLFVCRKKPSQGKP
jgi:2-polyprenyl-3-methyl-5-hydroxy-6-metoxy-1,4-benzoquinol methylase